MSEALDRKISEVRNGLKLHGRSETVGVETINIYLKNEDDNIVLCSGTTVPTADTAGYAKGALFIKTNAADGTKGVYENQGTTAASDFNLIGDISSAEIADGAVSLAKLATAVAPSHVVKFAGEFTTAGGDAAEQASVSGVLATDIVVASILDNGTNNVTLLQSAAGTDVIDFTMSADPSTDCIISYVVFRATA